MLTFAMISATIKRHHPLPQAFLLTLTLTLTLSTLPTPSRSHGLMCTPRQRGAYKSPARKCPYDLPIPTHPIIDYCAHCLNAGTKGTVRANLPPKGWRPYNPLASPVTARRGGLCGDPVGRTDHMIGGAFMPYTNVPIVEVYKTGAEVDFMAEIDTNHNGYFEFYLCDLDACGTTDIDVSCFEKKACYRLNRVPHPDCQNASVDTTYECGPVDRRFPSRWYLPCRNTGHVGIHIVGGEEGTMRYKLPDGVSCKHCVIQWYWATANSCNPPGKRAYFRRYKRPFGTTCASDGGGRGAHAEHLGNCKGDRLPEEFWSCADVQITADGASAGPIKAVGMARETPGSRSDDDMEAKKDPDGTMENSMEEMEEDIQGEADKREEEEKKEEQDAMKGKCILHDEPCDATVPCCDVSMVCVYTIRSGGFTCRYWWALWNEVHDQEKRMGVMS